MKTPPIILRSQSVLSGSVREGDLLLVRILRAQGSKYLASFGGGRFWVRSDAVFKAGDVFRARVGVVNSKVVLSVQQDAGQGGRFQGGGVQNFGAQSPEIAVFLAAMGLEADGISEKMLAFLMKSGSKIDGRLMQRLRRLAKKFPKKENLAACLALVLEEKGISAESGFLVDLLDLFDMEGEGEGFLEDESVSEPKGDQQLAGFPNSAGGGGVPQAEGVHGDWVADAANIAAELRRFFESALAGGVPQAEGRGSVSVQSPLALFNHLARRNSADVKKTWIMLPFEFGAGLGNAALSGGGVFRIFLDLEKNAAEKCLVNFKTRGDEIFFDIGFENKKVSRVAFCAAPESLAQRITERLDELSQTLGVEVLVTDEMAFGAEDFSISSVEAFA